MDPVIVRRQSQRIKNRMSNNALRKEEKQSFQQRLDFSQIIKKQINTQRYFGANLTNQPMVINLKQTNQISNSVQHQQIPQHLFKNPLITLSVIQQKFQPQTKRSEVQIYQTEIANHLHKYQNWNKQIQDYLPHQPQISEENRQMLVTWLIQIHEQFQLKPQSLFKTIHILDKVMFLQKCQISKFEFQLLGLVSLYVSSKYQQVTVQNVRRYANKISFSISDIHQIQSRILISMNFNLVTISPLRIMQLYCEMFQLSDNFRLVCQSLLWMCLLQYGMNLYYQPHLLGICSISITNSIIKQKNQLPQKLRQQALKNKQMFESCLSDMNSVFERRYQSKFDIIRKKFVKISIN